MRSCQPWTAPLWCQLNHYTQSPSPASILAHHLKINSQVSQVQCSSQRVYIPPGTVHTRQNCLSRLDMEALARTQASQASRTACIHWACTASQRSPPTQPHTRIKRVAEPNHLQILQRCTQQVSRPAAKVMIHNKESSIYQALARSRAARQRHQPCAQVHRWQASLLQQTIALRVNLHNSCDPQEARPLVGGWLYACRPPCCTTVGLQGPRRKGDTRSRRQNSVAAMGRPRSPPLPLP